jgi:thioredoxin reductase (NADPH)
VKDLLIVGAGPAGLATAIAAREAGLDYEVLEKGVLVNSIFHFPRAMTFFTTPELLEIGGKPFVTPYEKPTQWEALRYYRRVADSFELKIRMGSAVLGLRVERDGFALELEVRGPDGAGTRETLRARNVAIATGYYDRPNRLGVPGEDLPHVSHYADEPHVTWGQRVVIVGGKNSAVEAALLYFRAGARVSLVYRRQELRPSVKYWLRPDLENRIRAGEIRALFGAEAVAISASGVRVRRSDGEVEEIPADRVYALTGYHPDFSLFERIGVVSDPVTGKPTMDAATLESNVPGVHLAGSAGAGRAIGEVFIENGRLDGEKIFGTAAERARAASPGGSPPRPEGE